MIRSHATVVALLIPVFWAGPAWAHAFGQRYDLPLPLWLYVTGGGAAVALSFVIAAIFLKHGGVRAPERTITIGAWPGRIVRAVSLALFGLVLLSCFIGADDPLDNFAPTFVWVIWWVGLAFVSALIGNLWDAANPWNAIFCHGEPLFGRRQARDYPEGLGHWPAVALFLAFVWMELIADAGEDPRVLGWLILIYSAITWAGMAAFGRGIWLRHGEVFTVVFGLLARFAPVRGEGGQLRLRIPATGLLTDEAQSLSKTVFVLLLLTSVTFDGVLETPAWRDTLAWIAQNQALNGLLSFLQDLGMDPLKAIKTAALLLLPLLFVLVYALFAHLVAWSGQRDSRPITGCRAAGWFVLSLVPIAIAYHLAHYLSYLLIAGQNIIPLASDPFGRGWDLFGTAAHRLDITVVNAKMIWYTAVTAIVTGHVAAVYLAHETALQIFETRRQALISQLPMMALMVGYTMISLWVLSQPIVM